MTAYIVNTEKFEVTARYPDISYASYAMSDNYGWHPNDLYIMLHNEDAAYNYWYQKTHGNTEHGMFKDWSEK